MQNVTVAGIARLNWALTPQLDDIKARTPETEKKGCHHHE